MKTNSLFWALSWVAVGSFAIMQGCGGDDDDDGGDDASGGEAGSSGSATGGSSGSSGRGGSSGSSGRGGSSGEGGTATGGAAGAPAGAGGAGGDEGVGGEGGGGTADPARVAACQVYCGSYFAHMCEMFAADTYDNVETCQSTCEDSSWEIGVPGVAGNTINCRLSHADLASGADQELHCSHASENPEEICVD